MNFEGGFPFDLNEPATEEMEDRFQFDLNEQPTRDTEGHTQHEHHCHHYRRRTKLSCDTRSQILMWLLNNPATKNQGKPYQGAIQDVARIYNTSRRTVSSIWSTAKKQQESNQRYNMATKMHKSGRKRIQLPPTAVTDISMGDRSCIRDLAVKLKVSPSTANRMIKRGLIKPHTNPLHPGLKDANMKHRMAWVLDLLMGETAQTKRKYISMFDFIHIDEKWFYLSKKSQKVYLEKNEKGTYRSASSSKFIPKVMFTAAVARPRYNADNDHIVWHIN